MNASSESSGLPVARSPWAAFAATGAGTFMSAFDASAVNVALPSMVRDLGTTLGNVQWVVNSYLLLLTAALLVFGKLSDVLGRRRIYVGGMLLFAASSGLCAASGGVWSLVVWRAFQGLGASMATAVGPALIVDAFPVEKRGRALGSLSTVAGGGLIVGPSVGGLILGAASWRWIFIINIPIGLIAAGIAMWAIPKHESTDDAPPFDWVGSITGGLSLVGLLAALNLGPEVGWFNVWTVGTALLGVAGAVGFVVTELRVEHPMLDLELVRRPRVRDGLLACLASFITTFLAVYLVPFYLEDIVSTGPVMMGFIMTSLPLALLICAPLAGMVTDRWGAVIVGPAGMIAMAIALIVMALSGGYASPVVMAICLGLIGGGMGIFQAPNNTEVMNAVEMRERGSTSAALAVTRNLGTVLGIALASTLFQVRYLAIAGTRYAHTEGSSIDPKAFDAAFRIPVYVGVATAIATVVLAWMAMAPSRQAD